MYIAIVILIVILSILLTLFVLVQNSKGGGLSAGFSSSNQIMGVRKTTDFVEKMTWGLVIGIVLLSVVAVGIRKNQATEVSNESEIKEQYQHAKQAEPGVVTPNFGEKPEAATPAAKPAIPAKK
jgi:preprotein translocase subunit SecG